jgi:RecB family exonuclease
VTCRRAFGFGIGFGEAIVTLSTPLASPSGNRAGGEGSARDARARGLESTLQPRFRGLDLGRLDRVDQLADGQRMVMDYKTESQSTTADRVKSANEDTQLAFYAALLPDDTLRAAYVNISERETRPYEQKDVVAARDALLGGIRAYLAAIADGAPLPALGEGTVCDFCAARGLCRKDFWA